MLSAGLLASGCAGDPTTPADPPSPTETATEPATQTSEPVDPDPTASATESPDPPAASPTEAAQDPGEVPPVPDQVDGWERSGNNPDGGIYTNEDDPGAEIINVYYGPWGEYDFGVGELDDERVDEVWYCGTTKTEPPRRQCNTNVEQGGSLTFTATTEEALLVFAEAFFEEWEWDQGSARDW